MVPIDPDGPTEIVQLVDLCGGNVALTREDTGGTRGACLAPEINNAQFLAAT